MEGFKLFVPYLKNLLFFICCVTNNNEKKIKEKMNIIEVMNNGEWVCWRGKCETKKDNRKKGE